MSALKAIIGTRVTFGTTPDTVPETLLRSAPVLVFLGPAVFVAALTQLPAPFAPFRGDYGPAIAMMSYAGTAVMSVTLLAVTLLILMRRAVGVLFWVPAFAYANMMISALMVAVVPIGSLTLLLGTVVLVAWSLFGLRRVNSRIPHETIQKLRAERLFVQDGRAYLLPATALEGGGVATKALHGLRSGFATVLEFIGALVVIALGAFVVPVAIASDFGSQGILAPLLWFISVSIFLIGRGTTNMMWMLARVIAQGPVKDATP